MFEGETFSGGGRAGECRVVTTIALIGVASFAHTMELLGEFGEIFPFWAVVGGGIERRRLLGAAAIGSRGAVDALKVSTWTGAGEGKSSKEGVNDAVIGAKFPVRGGKESPRRGTGRPASRVSLEESTTSPVLSLLAVGKLSSENEGIGFNDGARRDERNPGSAGPPF